ncbi:YlzJ-like family protein [Paenibacillus sp. sgz302251]|uniref:YlzJ-like family protein n=1 Tax=Paenibacillus sp. sgz302251 TaxID=3414493 RepID=UPI003C7D4E20
MTLYTSIPLELVLDGINNEMDPLQEVWVNGVKMQVMPIAPGIGKIVRLLECGLHDYLNPDLTPGMLVSFQAAAN